MARHIVMSKGSRVSVVAVLSVALFLVTDAFPPQQFGYPAVAGQHGVFIPFQNASNNNNYTGNNNYGRSVGFPQNGTSQKHQQITHGRRQNGDVLLFNTIVSKKMTYSLFRSSISKEITFPDKHSKRKIQKINCIVVTDNTKNGTGGFMQIMNGGIEQNHVTMRFVGQDRKSIDLSVSIYGMEKNK